MEKVRQINFNLFLEKILLETLVSWCSKPSQPQRIISGLKETFIKRYKVERTNTTVS